MAQIISKLRAGRGAGRTHPPATAPAGGAVGPRPPFRRRGHHLLLRHRHLLSLPLHRTFPLPFSVSDSLLLRLRRRSGRAATLFFLGRRPPPLSLSPVPGSTAPWCGPWIDACARAGFRICSCTRAAWRATRKHGRHAWHVHNAGDYTRCRQTKQIH
jgi:hypothetical protein